MKKEELDWMREEGLRRYRIIVPLLDKSLAECEKRPIRRLICTQEGISDRTLRRYVAAYKRQEFEGLLPRERKDKGSSRSIPEAALKLAAQLRQEVPERSAERIQELLASEGYRVARSTLERHLRQQGLSGREVQAAQKQVASRRFNRVGRNTLWQADLKYGPYLPDTKQPEHKIRTYLISIIDDATRLVVHGEFYDNQRLPVLEDAVRKAVIEAAYRKIFTLIMERYLSPNGCGWLAPNCISGILIPMLTRRKVRAKLNAGIARWTNLSGKRTWKSPKRWNSLTLYSEPG